jgi:hypothetical protein
LHLLAGGVLTLQTEGKDRALVMLRSRGIPRFAPPVKASHKQCGSSFTTFFRPEQQSPSGFVKLLPCSTYDKQPARLSSAGVQSTVGAGAGAVMSAFTVITIRLRKSKRDSASFLAMTVVPDFWKYKVLQDCVVGFIGMRFFSFKGVYLNSGGFGSGNKELLKSVGGRNDDWQCGKGRHLHNLHCGIWREGILFKKA